MTRLKIIEQIKDSELTEKMRELSDLVGRDSLNELLHYYSKQEKSKDRSVYIPLISQFKTFIRRYINENPKKSAQTIAVELGIHQATVYNYRSKL